MKNALLIALVLFTVILSSCKKDDDFTIPDNLAGTAWKSLNVSYPDDEEYYIFKFTSKTIVDAWIKYKGDLKLYDEMSGIYSISGNKITIDFGDEPITGVIDGNTMNFVYDGEVIVFTKQ